MNISRLTSSDVESILPNRHADSHKGDYGRVLLICGSKGYTGAPALAALGALRSGAGLVYLAVPDSIYEIEAVKLTEPIILPMPDDNGTLAEGASEIIRNLLPKMDAVLIGPGLGQSAGVFSTVKTVLESFHGPVVLDADGINVIAAHKNILRRRTDISILTPHPGEFRRLSSLNEDRVDAAVALANELGAVVVLKGHGSIITDGENCMINSTGNPGMAVGGSGDVLAGIIVSLVGQGIAPLQAAACGAWLHGAAGDICAQEIGQYGMLPTDMLNVLPRLMK